MRTQGGLSMKKNMISVIILALLVVNIALTGVMMFSIISTEKEDSQTN
jgi:flagellar FliL protein